MVDDKIGRQVGRYFWRHLCTPYAVLVASSGLWALGSGLWVGGEGGEATSKVREKVKCR